VLRAAQEGLSRFPGKPLDWVEVDLEVRRPDGTIQELRTLLDASSGEGVGEPQPPLPDRFGPAPPG